MTSISSPRSSTSPSESFLSQYLPAVFLNKNQKHNPEEPFEPNPLASPLDHRAQQRLYSRVQHEAHRRRELEAEIKPLRDRILVAERLESENVDLQLRERQAMDDLTSLNAFYISKMQGRATAIERLKSLLRDSLREVEAIHHRYQEQERVLLGDNERIAATLKERQAGLERIQHALEASNVANSKLDSRLKILEDEHTKLLQTSKEQQEQSRRDLDKQVRACSALEIEKEQARTAYEELAARHEAAEKEKGQSLQDLTSNEASHNALKIRFETLEIEHTNLSRASKEQQEQSRRDLDEQVRACSALEIEKKQAREAHEILAARHKAAEEQNSAQSITLKLTQENLRKSEADKMAAAQRNQELQSELDEAKIQRQALAKELAILKDKLPASQTPTPPASPEKFGRRWIDLVKGPRNGPSRLKASDVIAPYVQAAKEAMAETDAQSVKQSRSSKRPSRSNAPTDGHEADAEGDGHGMNGGRSGDAPKGRTRRRSKSPNPSSSRARSGSPSGSQGSSPGSSPSDSEESDNVTRSGHPRKKPVVKTTRQVKRTVARDMRLALVRDIVKMLFKVEHIKEIVYSTQPSPETVAKFEANSGDGPTADNFGLDVSFGTEAIDNHWNLAARHLIRGLIEKKLNKMSDHKSKKYNTTTPANDYNKLIRSLLERVLRKTFQFETCVQFELRKRMDLLGHDIDEATASDIIRRLMADKVEYGGRYHRRYSRRHVKHDARIRVSCLMYDAATRTTNVLAQKVWRYMIDLVLVLGHDGMSSDESERDEGSNVTTLRCRRLPWRRQWKIA
ncbi:hypothetical protein BDZ89DRAFT_1137709 [Hymenopellis radicata]|nr:hypothetical protein BDZ89DRAFT_1137709 [Hymenopellis radicata]